MKIYCNKIELSKPAPIQIWVSKNSDYGIGLYVTKNGVGTSFLLFDGETELSPSFHLDKYTVYNITAANKAETKVLTVKSNNQEIKLTVNTTASNCAEYTPPVPPVKPGLGAEGVKTMLSDGSVISIQLTEDGSLLFVNGSIGGKFGGVNGNWVANNLIANGTLFLDYDAVIIFGSPFDDQNRVTLTKEDVVKLKALIANS